MEWLKLWIGCTALKRKTEVLLSGTKAHLRLLFLTQNFRQGWGGGPESVRLMANFLAAHEIEADVFDAGRVCRNVGQFTILPESGSSLEPFEFSETGNYDAILLVGPWQNPLAIRRVLAQRRREQPLYYLPRGGLARVEFNWPRGLKKLLYFFLIERRLLCAANAVIYSSSAEQMATIAPARRLSSEHVIPDFVSVLAEDPNHNRLLEDETVTFAFLAEISPRKNLLKLTKAFVEWCRENDLADRVRLVIGGSPRPGCEGYLEKVQTLLKSGTCQNVEVVGPISHADRGRFYRDVDIMVVSSLFESFGLTVIEALTAGCSLLVAPLIGALEYISDTQSITVAQGDNVVSLKAGLKKSYSDFILSRHLLRKKNAEVGRCVVGEINKRALDAWTQLITTQ